MNKLFAKMYHFPKRAISQVGVGIVVTALVVITQAVSFTKFFSTPATRTPNPEVLDSSTTVPMSSDVSGSKDAGSSGVISNKAIPAAIKVEENVCQENITRVDNPGKLQRMVIPAISMGLPIVRVPLENGTWQVYDGVANFAEATSEFNGDVGNSLLYGHNQDDAFKPIAKLKKGDLVHVQTSKYQFTYEVYATSAVAPNDMSVVQVGNEKQLTLLTCNGFFDEKRLIVKTRLVKITQLNCVTK